MTEKIYWLNPIYIMKTQPKNPGGRPALPDEERMRITSVMLPPDLREVIVDLAETGGTSQSKVIRQLLVAGLERRARRK